MVSVKRTSIYQVQAQVNICDVEFGDFVVWTEGGIAVEKILRIVTFMKML